jgi:diguanylate cyclase (GGDEF)-like protein
MLATFEKWFHRLARRYKTVGTILAGAAGAYWFIDSNLLDKRMTSAVLSWAGDLPSTATTRFALTLYLVVLLVVVGVLVVRLRATAHGLRQQQVVFDDHRKAQQLANDQYKEEQRLIVEGYQKEIELLQAGRVVDKLTKIKNREGLEIDFPRKLQQLKVREEVFFLAYLDVVNLKKINKDIGHELANEVMRDFASTMKKELRGQDELYRLDDGSGVYRLEGDQFVMILNNKSILDARKGALSINKRLHANPIRLGRDPVTFKELPPIHLAYRCGITDCTTDDQLKDCLARADAALKLARRDDTSEGQSEDAIQLVSKSDVARNPEILKIAAAT